jgi:hypothetical protein
MSRIIVSRHANDEERTVLGWDPPLQTYFADRYDSDGESVGTVGPLAGMQIDSVAELRRLALYGDIIEVSEWSPVLEQLLAAHRELEYPESNVVIDLSR